jgi:hypothetical protein
MNDLMNRCDFNLSAIGNHEFDLGQDQFNARQETVPIFPFISCNNRCLRGKAEAARTLLYPESRQGEDSCPGHHSTRRERYSPTPTHPWLEGELKSPTASGKQPNSAN